MRLPPKTAFSPVALLAPAVLADTAPVVPGVATGSFIQGMIGLLVVVALILLAAWLVRRLNLTGATGNAAGMKVVSGLSVGPRERILLLEIGESWIVIGVTATQMRTLHTLPKGLLPDTRNTHSPKAFGQLLRQFSGRRDAQ